MDRHISCLLKVNEKAKDSTDADFEFSEPREAVIFAQWVGAFLPSDGETPLKLPGDLVADNFGWYEGGRCNPLLSKSLGYLDISHLMERRYVRFLRGKYKGEAFKSAYSREIEEIIKRGLKPQSFVLVDLGSSYPHYNEPFWEYLAGCYFRKLGYLVTRWMPRGVYGNPDMAAYKSPRILNPLREHGLVGQGCFLFELELPLAFGRVAQSMAGEETEYHSMVVEAESSPNKEMEAVDQLHKRRGNGGYLKSGHFDEGYITGPDFQGRQHWGQGHFIEHTDGVLSNTPDGKLFHRGCEYKSSKPESKEEGFRELEQLVKLVLAKNLSLGHLTELCADKECRGLTFRELIDQVSLALERLSIDEVCSLYKK